MLQDLVLHVGSVECIWLEININNKKYLYGTFYIPPNSGQQIWEELEQSIDLALNINHDIIITGDFNIHQFGNNTTETDNLLAQFSFHQLITEPIYVTERSSSLLDLVLVNNPIVYYTLRLAHPCWTRLAIICPLYEH